MIRNRQIAKALAVFTCATFAPGAILAQAVTGSLIDVAAAANFNALERAAARANQATYNQLVGACTNGISSTCPANNFVVFENTRELVETANELRGQGSTQFSLGLDAEGLGFALRWTAAEELAGEGSATTKFAASQLSALATRLSVLRWGVSGLRSARNDDNTSDENNGDDVLLAGIRNRSHGGGASSDVPSDFSRWGSFVDASYGYGDKGPTDLEDAFDFDGQEVTIGMDHRFSPAVVAGAIFGYSDKEIDFDSARSIVDGGIVSDGFSVILFGMLEGDHAYMTGSLGYQSLSHDVRRRITYPSLNPTVPSVDSTATSSTDSSSFLATANAGYAWRFGAFTLEPSVDLSYSDTSFDAFTERSVDNLNPSVANDPFDLRVGRQSIQSLDLAPALKLQYVLTPSFGVIVPYAIGRYHFQLSDDARRISARYADAIGQLAGIAGTDFAVSTDKPDEEYYTLAGGLTVVLPHGLNGFLQYLEVFALDSYSDSVITGGFRFEF